ncbi:aluminum-activated malate transporter 10-like [Zingiber officinale]|uniref:aluminum-activated malate transporter 10-like n=1 Tax=Zingiber officinale TaxID=94328 RepID=UPI001C4C1DB1|nr:aluminum-activated malate transporter 10-like [Zingiber officinale]
MAGEKEASRRGLDLEWQVTVSGAAGSSVKTEAQSPLAVLWVCNLVSGLRLKAWSLGRRVWQIGADDPRKVIHGMKVGLALVLTSVFYYTRPLYDGVGGTAMWAVMTVVVVFEYTVGGTLYKGLNRATATVSAGSLAFGIHWLAIKSGKTADHIILGTSIFILSSAATFFRFIPTLKARFDYGLMIFILTFNLVAVSGYRVDQLLALAQWRFCTITLGFCICLTVCIVVRPVWAGEELHCLTTRNMEKLAESLQESVAEYLKEEQEEEEDSEECKHTCSSQKLQGFKCVLNSKASEDSLANLARWEPPHGRFSYGHPWRQYLKIGAAMRHCAYCIESLTNCCISSENLELPDSVRSHLADAYLKLSSDSAKVLKELAGSFKSMRKPSSVNYLVKDMKNTADELQTALSSVPQEATVLIMETLPLITVASLLIEISKRVEGVAVATKGVTGLSCFRPSDGDDELKVLNKVVPAMA